MNKKFVNEPENIVPEVMEGLVACFPQYIVKHPEVNGIISKHPRKDKVTVVIGGGSGHEPTFCGFVGRGLADASANGNIFASPDPATIYKTAKAAYGGKAVLFMYGNYSGDNLNFDMAEEMLREDGIECTHCRTMDDCASAPKERFTDRRGIAGNMFVFKVGCACADAGLELDEIVKVVKRAHDNMRSIGVAASSAHIPGAAEPIFTLGEDEMEYGMGIHGEKGIKRTKMASADEIAEYLYEAIKADMPINKGDEVGVLVNGLGSTTVMEMAIVYRKLKKLLDADGVSVYTSDINSYCTTLEMGGFSITIIKLDDEIKKYLDAPCDTPYYRRGAMPAGEVSDFTPSFDEVEPEGENKHYNPEEGKKYVDSVKGSLDKENLSPAGIKAMLLTVADAIVEAEPMLTKVDSAIGDGDHGIGMKGGLKKAHVELLKKDEKDNAYAPFSTAGNAMLMSMGGASGFIFGNLFLAGPKGETPKASLNSVDIAHVLRKALTAIKEKGEAQVGDKTMVDALEPAVIAMEKASGEGMLKMLRAGEAAALEGVENTKKVEAKFGRAKTQGTTIGFQDAGATSVWVIIKAMGDFIESL